MRLNAVIIAPMEYDIPPTEDGRLQLVNQQTRKRYRRQVFLEIWLPLVLVVLLLGALLVLFLKGGGSVEGSAQVASIMLAAIIGVLGVFLLIAAIFFIVAVSAALRWLPPHSYRLHVQMRRVNHVLVRGADQVAAPLLLLDSWGSALKRMLDRWSQTYR